jgi:cytochrome c oxidase subunit 2
MCTITHAHEVAEDQLRVPVGRPIKLHVWTNEPKESGVEVSLVGTPVVKAVASDKPVEIAFRIDRPGTYEWKCPTITPPPDKVPDQQNPVKQLHAIPATEYDAFIQSHDQSVATNVVELGKKLYQVKGCSACHTIDGSARVGPTWKGIWGTTVTSHDGKTRLVDENFVRESILAPQAFVLKGFPPATMPSFEGQLREREIEALIRFIESLK